MVNLIDLESELIGDVWTGAALEERHRFAAEAGLNKIWLKVDFGDDDFEMAVVRYVQQLLGRHYTPFQSPRITACCPRDAAA